MFDRDLWSEIFYSIKKNKLRTFLTGFSVAWGIFILVMLLASVNGMQNGFLHQFADDAKNSIFISPSSTTKPYAGFEAGRKINFTNDDLKYIQGSFQEEVEYITPRVLRNVTAKYKKETGSYSVRAVFSNHQKIEKTIIDFGRYINENDIYKKNKVAVIGKMVKKDLFADKNPVGETFIMNNSTYKIIGVFSDEGNEREERFIYTPATTTQRLYGNTDKIDQIVLTYNPSFTHVQAINFSNALEGVLKRKHKVDPDDQGAIFVNNNAEAFSDISNFTTMLNGISVGVGILILIAGIVGIGNILVFIIKERTKEIGIRKALGAKPNQVISLVILESVFITVLSGLGGMVFAMLLLKALGSLIQAPAFRNPSVNISTVITATVILIVSGIFAGLIPAVKAANVKPVVALSAD